MPQSSSDDASDEHTGAFSQDLFKGTARCYARYRVPPPRELLDDLLVRARIGEHGRLLDLACGPGRVALPLSSAFAEVCAVDQEPEMIDVGREEALLCRVTNIRWMLGRAEELEAQPESFDLITIGDAFHRLDRPLIARRALQWLLPGRCLATVGCFGITTGSEPWQLLLREVAKKWRDRASRGRSTAPSQPDAPRGFANDRQVLTAAGFEDVASYDFTFAYIWTVRSIIGNLYSTSWCSQRVVGIFASQFEAEVTQVLLSYDASGQYPETMRFGYTLARKSSSMLRPIE